jgi:CheY-like chemotaxis protein
MSNLSGADSEAPKMLIADDDPAIVQLLAERCTSMGFTVETAVNGLQALIKANRYQPDILIIDVNMPEVDGLSVCARLLDPGRKPLNVIVVTGSRDTETAERCESFGAFHTRKGPDFWENLMSAIVEIFPSMEDKIRTREPHRPTDGVRMRPRVLVVDDDPSTEEFLSSRLSKHGVDTLYASNALQGYRIACKERPSVIICDYFMPNGDALYLLSRLRGTLATESMPVFVLSGRLLDDPTRDILAREICGRPGAARIFRKSFDTQELFEALQEHCSFKRN